MAHKKPGSNQKHQGYDPTGHPDPATAGELGELDLYAGTAAGDAAARRRLASLQVRQNFVGTLVTIRRISFKAAHDDANQPIWQRRIDQFRTLRLFLYPLI